MTILSRELFLSISNECVVDIVLNKVDGAATKASTHDTAAANSVGLGNLHKKIKFLTAYLIFLGEAFVGLVHLTAYGLVIACLKSITDGEDAVFFT